MCIEQLFRWEQATDARNNEPELYSDKELAERAIEGSDMYIITPVHLNERFWND